MYYGGEPAAWTLEPAIPPEALYRESSAAVEPPSTTGHFYTILAHSADKSLLVQKGMKF